MLNYLRHYLKKILNCLQWLAYIKPSGIWYNNANYSHLMILVDDDRTVYIWKQFQTLTRTAGMSFVNSLQSCHVP